MKELLFSPVGDFDWGPRHRPAAGPLALALLLGVATIIVAGAAAMLWWSIVAPAP